ncbi:MAG: DivIVA domain-containing protein [Actinomycetia bacterium]|nr:DivIVA domain-containing protein [Actinomycetes bacterium]
MRITPIDIQEKQFHLSLRGYNPEEVDVFLDTIAEELELLNRDNNDLKRKLEELSSGKEPGEVEKDEISEMRMVIENTLISAQKTAEEIIKNAKTEAENIKKEAKEKVGDIVLKSQDEIREMLNDIEEVGKIQDNLNQRLNKVYNKLSVVLKIRESEKKPSTLKEYLGEEVGEKQVEVKKSKVILEEEQQVEYKSKIGDEIKPEVKETNTFIEKVEEKIEGEKVNKDKFEEKSREKEFENNELVDKFFDEESVE